MFGGAYIAIKAMWQNLDSERYWNPKYAKRKNKVKVEESPQQEIPKRKTRIFEHDQRVFPQLTEEEFMEIKKIVLETPTKREPEIDFDKKCFEMFGSDSEYDDPMSGMKHFED